MGPGTRTPHLNPGLGQIDLQSHLLAGIHIRVLGLGEQGLQLLQLASREGGPFPPLLSWGTWGGGAGGGDPQAAWTSPSLCPLVGGPEVVWATEKPFLGVRLPGLRVHLSPDLPDLILIGLLDPLGTGSLFACHFGAHASTQGELALALQGSMGLIFTPSTIS